MYFICGVAWLVFGAVSGLFLLAYIAESAGFYSDNAIVLSFVQSISLETGIIRLIHVAGLFLIAAFCFLVGVGLCSYGFAMRGEGAAKEDERRQVS